MLQLKKSGHSCEVVSLNRVGALGELLKEVDIKVTGIDYKGIGGWRSYCHLRKVLKDIDADTLIMTGHHLLSMFALGNLCKGKRILAIHFHHSGVKPNWIWKIIYKIAMNKFNAITFPSEFILNEAEEILPAIKTKSHKISNPIKYRTIVTENEKSQARLSLGLPDNAIVVGNAGWLIERKRYDIFFTVAREIIKKFPSAIFIVAGDGPLNTSLRDLVINYGLNDNVVFMGWLKDMDLFYKSLDILLFNSDWDAVGLTPLEAMSYGVPVVASVKNGGLKEIISDERFGYLFDDHNIDLLVSKVELLINKPALAFKIKKAAHSEVHKIGNPKLILEQTLGLLK
jgi:glycosyltransferase involved in cell wall biosynthesis